jgi:hypothetical protein
LFYLAFCQLHFVFIFFLSFLISFPFRFLSHRLFIRYIHEFIVALFFVTTRSPFVPNMPRHTQSGRRPSFGIRVRFIESYVVFTICLCIYLCLRYKVWSYPVKQTKSYFTKSKQPPFSSRNNNLCFWWPRYTPLHLYRSGTRLPASVFHFLPPTFFPAQRSLSSGSPKWSWHWNLRRTVPNCPQWRQQSLSLLYQQRSAYITEVVLHMERTSYNSDFLD